MKKDDLLDFIKYKKPPNIIYKDLIYLSPTGIFKYYKSTKRKTSLYSKLLIHCLENSVIK